MFVSVPSGGSFVSSPPVGSDAPPFSLAPAGSLASGGFPSLVSLLSEVVSSLKISEHPDKNATRENKKRKKQRFIIEQYNTANWVA